MSLRLVAQIVCGFLGLIAFLSLFDFIDLGVLIWPLAIGAIATSFYVVTTPSHKDVGHG